MNANADYYREKADEARSRAEKTADEINKERWLKIADHWRNLAAEAERLQQRNS